MSRPSRYGPKPQSQTNTFDKNGPNGTDAAAAVGLNKARAQFNEPIVQLQAIFPDWKEEDLISVLEEVKGDVELAVARISEGHAEQWGAVKHKKEKKQPAVAGGHRERGERERGDRDRDRDHTSPRGTSSPRGRGRGGGQRGVGPHSGASRNQPHQHRDRTTNGSSAMPVTSSNADSTWLAAASSVKDFAPEATAPDGWGLTSAAETGEDQWATATPATHSEDTGALSGVKHEELVEAIQTAPPRSHDQKPTPTQGATKTQSKPGSSGRSWADIAKPTKKPPPIQNTPAPAPVEPPSATPAAQDTIPEALEPTREEPTTVEAPTWDDEPVVTQPPATPVPEQPTTADGWVDANPTSEKSERTESWTDLGDSEQMSDLVSRKNTTEPPPSTEPVAPAQQQQQEPQLQPPQVQQLVPSSFSPPPGLANPGLSTSPAPPKPTTPSNSRPAFGVHRPSSRFKTDQAVIIPPSSQGAVAGFAISKTLPLQFGSLNLSGDNNETQPSGETTAPDQQQHATEQKQAYGNGQSPSAPPMTTGTSDTLQASQSQPSVSPGSAYRIQGQQQPQQEESPAALNPNVPGAPAYTQAPSINPTMTPGPGTAFPPHQHHPVASHHTLAGLAHAPHHSGPQALGHSHHPSVGQQGSFPPQQQQYEGATASGGGAPFSGLGQSPQGQSQFFRQTDSPFYNQTHTPLAEHGFGGGSAGGFGQGMQTSFNGGPGLSNDFGYDGQRNPYDNYPSQNAFVGRGALRQDDVKSLGASPGQGLSAHHGSAQPSPLTGQPSGGQGQGQYPGMGHMGNTFYYNMNMSPYGYANTFYPPAFTSFPVYQAGAQTPPHGAKPGNVNASVGLGASGNSAYSSTNSGHLQHASSGFDGDNGPNGTSTYHTGNSTLPGDFQKGPYTGAQNFLGAMGAASGGVSASRGPGNVVGVAPGGVSSSTSPETAFKGYGGSAASGLGPAEKSLPTQAGRGAPGVNPGGHQQFYQNNRYSNVPQGQGYPQQQQQQGDSYYSNYQRW